MVQLNMTQIKTEQKTKRTFFEYHQWPDTVMCDHKTSQPHKTIMKTKEIMPTTPQKMLEGM